MNYAKLVNICILPSKTHVHQHSDEISITSELHVSAVKTAETCSPDVTDISALC